jgi:hypothetical protein
MQHSIQTGPRGRPNLRVTERQIMICKMHFTLLQWGRKYLGIRPWCSFPNRDDCDWNLDAGPNLIWKCATGFCAGR